MRILRAGLQPALRHYNRWMRLGCERLLHGAVGAHLHSETVPRNARSLVDAQIKTGKADGRFGHAPGDAPLAFGFVRDHVTGRFPVGGASPAIIASSEPPGNVELQRSHCTPGGSGPGSDSGT